MKQTRVDRADKNSSISGKNYTKNKIKIQKFCKEVAYYYKEFKSGKAIYNCPGAEREVEWSERKTCSKCRVSKSLILFSKNDCGRGNIFFADGRRNRRPECKVCATKDQEGKKQARAYAKSKGIPYKAPADTLCAICCHEGTRKNPLIFDHDHETNEFRGYIHNRCNIGLGILGDSVLELLKAVKYLNIGENLSKDVIISELFGE